MICPLLFPLLSFARYSLPATMGHDGFRRIGSFPAVERGQMGADGLQFM